MTKFLVGFIALIALGFWSSPASAVLNIYEPFNYSTGQVQGDTLDGTAGGFNAGTAQGLSWLQAGGGTLGLVPAGINVTSGSLTPPTALPPAIGNDLSITHVTGLANTAQADGFTNRLALNQSYGAGNTVYFSFLLDVTSLANSNNTTGGFFFSFNNTANSAQTGNPSVSPGRVQVRIDSTDATKYNLGVFGQEGATQASTAWATNQLDTGIAQLIVGSMSTAASGTREAKLWINPDPSTFGSGTAPAFTAHDTGDTAGWSGNNIASVLLRQNSLLPNLIMDELRVGSAWADVTPTLSLYWDTNGAAAGAGGSPGGNWDTSANWSSSSAGDATPQAWSGASYNAVFSAGGDATGTFTVNVSGTQSALGLLFEEGTPTLTGGTINLTGGKVTANPGVTATIESIVTGSAGLSKLGSGTVVLAGNATYTGGTTISAGTLQLGSGGTSGSLQTSSAIVDNGTLVVNRSDSVTQGTQFSGAPITGTGGFTQAGSGTTTLNAANTYSGTTTATAGTLTIKNTLAVQNSLVVTDAGGAIVFDPTMAGQNVTVGGLSSAGIAYTAPSNMSLTINAVTSNATYAGAIGGTGTMTKKGTFAQTLSGTNTYNGATSVNVGTLQYTQKAAMPASSAITVNGQSDWTVTSGTSTNFTGGILSVSTDDGSSGTKWSNSATSAAGTIGGLINGIGGQSNSVVWNNGSSLGVDIDSGLGDPSTGIEYSGTIGSFHTNSAPAGDFNHDNVVDAADYVIWRKGGSPNPNSAGDYNAWRSTYGATGGGSGTTNNVGFMKRGYGTLTLSGANTYSGQLKVNDEGGILRLTSVQTNAGQSMALPAVYIGGATSTTNTILKILTNNALPANSLIRFGTGSGGFAGILRLHDLDPPNTSIPSIPAQSFNQTIRGISGGNGQVQIGAGTLTIDTPTGESYAASSSRYQTDYDAGAGASGQHGTIIKTGAGRQDFDFFDTGGLIKGNFILQQGTVGIGNSQIFGLNPDVVDPNTSTNLPWPRLTINGGTLMNNSGSSLSVNVPNLFIGGSFTFDVVSSNNSQFSGGTIHTLTTLTASPTITVTAGTGGVFILPWKVQDDGTPRGITKAGPGVLTLGSEQNSYRGDTTIQEGNVRLSTNVISGGTVPVLGNQTTPGRLVLAGGVLEMNSNLGTTFASEFSGNPYAVPNSRTNIENNPIHVEAPNDNSAISFFAAPAATLSAGDIYFVFPTNSFDWTSGKLNFTHNGNNFTAGNTFRPTFTGNFSYAGPVVITNNTSNAGKTVLQSANTSGTQTWSNVLSGTGGFLRDGAGGTTVLSGINTYTGDTSVTGGVLSITHAYLADTADVLLSHLTDANAKLNLNFSGTDTIDQLFLNGVATTMTGTWGSSISGATHQDDTYFSGTGMLLISTSGGAGGGLTNGMSAVPEPAALSLVLLAIGPAMAIRRRKR